VNDEGQRGQSLPEDARAVLSFRDSDLDQSTEAIRPHDDADAADLRMGDSSAGDVAVGVTSLGFIGAALRRSARMWC